MRTRFITWATNSLLIVDGVSASPSSALHDTGVVLVIPPATVALTTGVSMGPVIVDVEPLSSPPPAADTEAWEDIAEFTVRRIPGAPVAVHGEMELPALDVPDLSPGDAEHLRFRVCVNGRDDFYDLAVSEPTEHFFVQSWLVSAAAEDVWSVSTSATATNRRGARRPPGGLGAVAG